MNGRERSESAGKLVGVKGAARYLGVSVKTFRDRIMPHTPTLLVSAPSAERQRRLFSVDALDEAIKNLQQQTAA